MPKTLTRLVAVVIVASACGRTALTEPVVANTGSARSSDGYEAALVTLESETYLIIVNDKANSFLRVAAKTNVPQASCRNSTFEIKAWPGSVDVRLSPPDNCYLLESEADRLHQENLYLAWVIAHHARMLAGEQLNQSKWPPGAPFAYPSGSNTFGNPVP